MIAVVPPERRIVLRPCRRCVFVSVPAKPGGGHSSFYCAGCRKQIWGRPKAGRRDRPEPLRLAPPEPAGDAAGCVPVVVPVRPPGEPWPEPVVTPKPEPEPCQRCGSAGRGADGRCVECRNAASRESRARRRRRAPSVAAVGEPEARTWVWEMVTLDPSRIGAVAAVDDRAASHIAEARRIVAEAYGRRQVHGDYWRWHGIAKAGMTLLEELEARHASL